MAARPSCSPPDGASTRITVPPEWFINVSAISRKTYHQAVFIQTNVRNNSALLESKFNLKGPMSNTVNGLTTFPITSRNAVVTLDISAFYTETPGNIKIRDSKYAASKFDIHSSSKLPTASPDIPDYVTYFIFVEDTSDAAQVAGSGQFDDTVVTVHLVKTNPNPIPPEEPNAIPGYNPVLDRPRPSTLANYLRAYDVVFLVDDSGSMQGQRWTEATQALNNLANWIIDNGWDSDGIDIYFLNSNYIFRGKTELVNGVQASFTTDKDKVIQAISQVSPIGNTPTGKRTQEILGAHINKLNAAMGTEAYGVIKPLNLICITDGEPNDDPSQELGKMLTEAAEKLRIKPKHHHSNSMGVQFVQIGADVKAREALVKLTQLDTGGMVDTVPYLGPGSINAERLERILLGGLHPNIRVQIP
ncbi:hypothetical protein BDZ94DRAFT_1219772 [Collybia nuda]|uniref:VWFA domain-containing protein n=1 Tax=Collybia nuda TaxID=64659 RepID=A0A9P5Y501_9AGAR|nr:hypothetical protein BDZ94DRAFT_1219772 [Collybia nuda]